MLTPSCIQRDIEKYFMPPRIDLGLVKHYLKNYPDYSVKKVSWGYKPPYNKYRYDYFLCDEDGIKIRIFTYNPDDTNYSGGYQ